MERIKLFIILPAFNEATVIGRVLIGLKKELKKIKGMEAKIIVVDDGSWDKTGKIAEKNKVQVLRHVINRGLGGALATGLEFAREKKADLAVTMDSDDQHDPLDIRKVINPIVQKKADVVIGSRFLKKGNIIPWDRQLVLWIGNLLTWFLFGIYTTDSQSGFRAFSQRAISKIKLRTQRMEVSSELFDQIRKNRLLFKEVPVRVIYTAYSRAKGQSNLNSIKILIKLILRIAR